MSPRNFASNFVTTQVAYWWECCLEVFCKKGVLKTSKKSQENTCARVTFLIKLHASLIFYIRAWRWIHTVKKETLKRETLAQVYSCEFCQILRILFSYITPVAASGSSGLHVDTTWIPSVRFGQVLNKSKLWFFFK